MNVLELNNMVIKEKTNVLLVTAMTASFHDFLSGEHRRTSLAPHPTQTSGLLYHYGGEDTRDWDDEKANWGRSSESQGFPMLTPTKKNLPKLEFAVGYLRLPSIQSCLEHHHNFLSGRKPSNKLLETDANAKNNRRLGFPERIAPITVEFLYDISLVIAIRNSGELQQTIVDVANNRKEIKMGIPFLGSSDHMIENIHDFDLEEYEKDIYWVSQYNSKNENGFKNPFYLYTYIDRSNSSKSVKKPFIFVKQKEIPEQAWVTIPQGEQ